MVRTAWYELTCSLVIREFKGRYRRTILGPLWVVMQPTLYLLIFLMLRSILSIESDGPPYALFAFAGLVPWTLFTNTITRAGQSVFSNASILKKMAFPRIILPTSAFVSCLLEFGIGLVVLLVLMACYGYLPGLQALWVIPLSLGVGILGLGVSLTVAAFGTFKQDILVAVPLLLQLVMFACPILYPLERVPDRWMDAYCLNPMVGLLEGIRGALLHNQAPEASMIVLGLPVLAVIWFIGLPLYGRCSQYFADVL